MNKFGGFVHTSPLCSSDPTVNPLLHLASNAIRDYFGPTVQTVADCLLSEAGCGSSNQGGGNSADGFTLISILQKVKKYCSRDINETRASLTKLVPGRLKISKARGPESSGFVVSDDAIAEALLTMVNNFQLCVCVFAFFGRHHHGWSLVLRVVYDVLGCFFLHFTFVFLSPLISFNVTSCSTPLLQ